MAFDYTPKFESFKDKTLFDELRPESREFIRKIAFEHRLTFQEFRQVVEAERDLAMWREGRIGDVWGAAGESDKKNLLAGLQRYLSELKRLPAYDETPAPGQRARRPVVSRESDKKIWGMCPVASEQTVCCNLRTIDAAENCVFGCSYCTVQTFYDNDIVFDKNFVDKLRAIPIEADRFYHFGTGQASDSLAFGNRDDILGGLCDFAAAHPNILLELKTKSANVGYFLDANVPDNVVCSWSLNTPTIIRNEEHFTATLEQRLDAARQVADRGIGVAFHFHPMVYYDGWESDYAGVATRVVEMFDCREVSFLSMGSVTLIRPVLKKIRDLGNPTKMTQIDFVADPHGKLTYSDDVKIAMFQALYRALEPWHGRVFMYLCMEKAKIWKATFGRVYMSNDEFERDFGRAVMGKSGRSKTNEAEEQTDRRV